MQQQASTAKDVRAFFAGRTRMSYGPGHGTQVSYASPDGRIFLWYPGNRVVLPGEWRAREERITMRRHGEALGRTTRADVCFRYGSSTYNPVTGHRGGGWECTPFSLLKRLTRESRSGDVFGLSARAAVPFVLSPQPTIIDNLRREAARAR